MFLTAPLLHDGYRFLPAGSALEVADNGTIVAIHTQPVQHEVVQYEGILCPGFVNVHCHLELSHMKGLMPEHTGLIPFLKKVPLYRTRFTDEQIKAARHQAYQELLKNGIVAVGDIANLTDTLDVRALDQLHIHTFVECIGFTEQHAQHRYEAASEVYNNFAKQQPTAKMLRQSIVPHAPYSVSQAVFSLIDHHQPQSLISIHNQESREEDAFYKNKTGAVRDLLGGFGINDDFFLPSGKSSLQTYSDWLSPDHALIFVHNTFSKRADVDFAMQRFQSTFWCLCPNANLYLENTLPDVEMLMSAGAEICIGTDSLASNHQLSVLAELETLKRNYPDLTWELLLQWGTINGAKALRMNEQIGSFEVGKKPGIINLLEGNGQTSMSVRRVL